MDSFEDRVAVVKNSRTETSYNILSYCDYCGPNQYYTYLITMDVPHNDSVLNLCPSCLQKMIDMIHKRCLEDCHVNTRSKD